MEASYDPITFSLSNLENMASATPYIRDGKHALKVSSYIEEHADIIENSLTSMKGLSDKVQVTEIGDDLKNIRVKLQQVLTDENESNYPDLADAHRHLDALQRRIDLQVEEPELMQSLDKLGTIIGSYLEIPKDRGFRSLDDGRFVAVKHLSKKERISSLSYSLEVMIEPLTNVKRWLIENRGEIPEGQLQWVEEKLTQFRDGVDEMMQEFPKASAPAVAKKAHASFHEHTPSEVAKKAAPILEECAELMAVQDFELVATDLVIATSQFHTLLEKDDLKRIVKFVKGVESVIRRVLDSSEEPIRNFDKVLTYRKELTGLARTVQVIIPQGTVNMKDVEVVIQLKEHGKKWEGSRLAPVVGGDMREYRELPQTKGAKELEILGAGTFKIAKNSVAFPFSAINDKGQIDESQISHTTTLTPKTQTKDWVRRAFVGANMNLGLLKTRRARQLKSAADSFSAEIEYLKKFKGRGVLPLVGSGAYHGSFELSRPKDFLLFFTSEEKVNFMTLKINMVTWACDGDLDNLDKSWTFQDKKGVVLDLISGLLRIHKEGYRHNDIKPGNVLYKRDDEGVLHGYLCDFGAVGERDMRQKQATKIFLPVEKGNFSLSLELNDCYATGLTVARLLTDRRIDGRVKDYWKSQIEDIDKRLSNEELLNEVAKARGETPSQCREYLIDRRKKITQSSVPISPEGLLEYIRATHHRDENPLAYAYALTHLHSYEDLLTKADTYLIEQYLGVRDDPEYDSSKSPITSRGNLTTPILEKFYEAIEEAESVDLSELIEPMTTFLEIEE